MQKALIFLYALAFSCAIYGQVVLDATFRPPIFERSALVGMVAPTLDGKVFIAGSFDSVGSFPRRHLARVLSDGRADLSFDAPFVENVDALEPMPDGRILLGGSIRLPSGENRAGVFRLLRSGALDPSFMGALPGGARGLRLAPARGGQIYVQIEASPFVVRLQGNGRLDPTFNPPSELLSGLSKMGVQRDGRLIIGRNFHLSHWNPGPQEIVRLQLSGRPDPAFNFRGPASIWDISQMAVRKDDRIWVVAGFAQFQPTGPNGGFSDLPFQRLVLLQPNGSWDRQVDVGFANETFVESMALTANDDLVIRGDLHRINGRVWTPMVARLGLRGQDLTFRPQSDGWPFAVDNRNSVYLCQALPADFRPSRVVRLDALGRKDSRFRVSTFANADLSSIVPARNGKLLVTGDFEFVNGLAPTGQIRLNADGSLDKTFSALKGRNVTAVEELEDGRLLFTSNVFTNNQHIGTLSTVSADGQTLLREEVLPGFYLSKFERDAEGRCWLVGGYQNSKIVRLSRDGVVETGFELTLEMFQTLGFFDLSDSMIETTSIRPLRNGGAVISTRTTSFGFCSEECPSFLWFSALFRLAPNGILDPAFTTIMDRTSHVLGMLLEQSDGKIIITTGSPGTAEIRRIFPDGRPDPSFKPTPFDPAVILPVVGLEDDSFIIGGPFTSVDGQPRKWMARVFKDGGLDANFKAGDAFDGPISKIVKGDAGDWLVHGDFEHVNGVARRGLARVRWN